jgi:hypothetical protein
MNSVLVIYRITRKFPKEERHGLIPQIKRSAVSEPSNIVKIIRYDPLNPWNPRILVCLRQACMPCKQDFLQLEPNDLTYHKINV